MRIGGARGELSGSMLKWNKTLGYIVSMIVLPGLTAQRFAELKSCGEGYPLLFVRLIVVEDFLARRDATRTEIATTLSTNAESLF